MLLPKASLRLKNSRTFSEIQPIPNTPDFVTKHFRRFEQSMTTDINASVVDSAMVTHGFSSLELRNVRYVTDEASFAESVFLRKERQRLVLKDVALEVFSGEIMCVMGSAGN